jgi:molybdopterin converting factor small subunit
MATVLGRQRIRQESLQSSLPSDPMHPAATRPNRITKLWELDAADGTLLASLRDSYLSAFAAVDARDAFKADAVKANRYTPDGLKEALRDHSVAQTAKIKAARNRIAKARERLAELEKETALPPPDQSEAASRLRDRVWQQLQRIDGPDRERTILKLAQSNPVVRELAGVAGSTYDQITGALARSLHGPKLAELESLREGVEVTESAVESADADLREEIGVHHVKDWAELTAGVKPIAETPWLRKGNGGVPHVVDMKTQRLRPATEEQIAAGRYFNDLAEYQAANAAA